LPVEPGYQSKVTSPTALPLRNGSIALIYALEKVGRLSEEHYSKFF
jgi:hypothetical protein